MVAVFLICHLGEMTSQCRVLYHAREALLRISRERMRRCPCARRIRRHQSREMSMAKRRGPRFIAGWPASPILGDIFLSAILALDGTGRRVSGAPSIFAPSALFSGVAGGISARLRRASAAARSRARYRECRQKSPRYCARNARHIIARQYRRHIYVALW